MEVPLTFSADAPILVTGATGDLGSAVVRELLRSGACVAAAVRRPVAEHADIAAGFDAGADRLRLFEMSCDSADSIDAGVRAIRDWGELSGFVHAAGLTRDGYAMLLPEADWDAVLDVNLKAAALLYRAAARSLMARRGGAVVFISSLSALRGVPGQAAYAASKGGLESLARVLAKEGAGSGIRVNCVAPGAIDGAMVEEIPEEHRARLREEIPFRRWGRPEEVATAVRFLLGEESSYITGAVLRVDGGLSA